MCSNCVSLPTCLLFLLVLVEADCPDRYGNISSRSISRSTLVPKVNPLVDFDATIPKKKKKGYNEFPVRVGFFSCGEMPER